MSVQCRHLPILRMSLLSEYGNPSIEYEYNAERLKKQNYTNKLNNKLESGFRHELINRCNLNTNRILSPS